MDEKQTLRERSLEEMRKREQEIFGSNFKPSGNVSKDHTSLFSTPGGKVVGRGGVEPLYIQK